MLKHTIMFAVVAGLVFVLGSASHAATTDGTLDGISRTDDMLESITLDGTEHPLDSLIRITMNDPPPSPPPPLPEPWYRQRGWIPQTDSYPATKEGAYAMASDGQISTSHNFLEWSSEFSPSYQDYTFDDPVPVGPDSEVALLGSYEQREATSVMTFTALDINGDPVPTTTYTPAFSSLSPNVQTVAVKGSDGFNAIWPWGHRWNQGPRTVLGAAMDFSPDDISEIFGLRIDMSGSVPPSSHLWIHELWAVGGDTPGDTNGDGVVDDDDLLNFEAQFGGPPAANSADFDTDGDVDLDDFATLRANWGPGTGEAPLDGAAAPEPATMTLLAIGGLMVLRRRRRL